MAVLLRFAVSPDSASSEGLQQKACYSLSDFLKVAKVEAYSLAPIGSSTCHSPHSSQVQYPLIFLLKLLLSITCSWVLFQIYPHIESHIGIIIIPVLFLYIHSVPKTPLF